jgi:hypothetical protein
MLNKISTIAFIKSEVEKGETDNGKTYHKIFCTSKCPSGKGYIPYSLTLWGNRFDAVLQYLQKEKPIYIEADLQEPKAYINKKGEPAVVLQGYATRIELLPRESKEQETEVQQCKIQELPVEEPLPF